MKQQFLKGKTETIRLTVYQNNRPIIPTSGTVTLYNPSGSEIQASTAVTVNSTTGEMTYSLTTTHTATLDLNYKAEWSYVHNSTTYYETQLFDVVRSVLSVPVTDDDLFYELESLRATASQATGTATSGGSSTLLDTTKRKEPDDYWKGGTIEIISGTGVGQKRTITGFTQSSSTLNVTPAFVTTPDTTSIYSVVRSYTDKILQAFEELNQMIYNKGKRSHLIIESSQIKTVLIYLTLEKICRDLSDQLDDKWDRLSATYMEKFKEHFNNIVLEYDEDESGTIEPGEEQQGLTGFRIFRT